MSTHNICIHGEICKIFWYPLLAETMFMLRYLVPDLLQLTAEEIYFSKIIYML